jgi:hypothetical protein
LTQLHPKTSASFEDDSLLSDDFELMLIRAFFDAVVRREDGGRMRPPVKLLSSLLIVARGRR